MDECVWSSGGMIVTGKYEVVVRNLPHCHFVHHKFLMNLRGTEFGSRGLKAQKLTVPLTAEC